VVSRRLTRSPTDDTGSLALALLLALVGMSLTALLVPVVLTQLSTTRSYVKRNHALNAAQGGLDVALAHIRAANDGAGNGELDELPCGPFAGSLVAGGPRYQVTITYLAADPRGQTEAWIATNAMTCLSGGGVTSTPAYAALRSEGDDEPSGTFVARRTLRATYQFQTTNQNIAGGLIHVYQGSPDLCFDAGSTSPAAGTNLQLRACDSLSRAQAFAYTDDLNLVLVSSKTASQPLGMCLDAAPASGTLVTFQPCVSPAAARQRWSLNDSSRFQGTTDGISLNSLCFVIQTPNTAGSLIALGSCSGTGSFTPEAAVGAGAAGASSGQLVNFSQFGRCLDVTEFWTWTTYGYLIDWPCKQAPSSTQVGQNQRWTLPTIAAGGTSGTGRISTLVQDPNTIPWCLQSPGSVAAGQYVRIALCPLTGALPLNLTWTVFADTGAYATSYQITDGYGYCLQATDQNATPADLYPYGNRVAKIIVRACDGSTLQKWNAPPGILDSVPFKDLGEQ
jgi:hypothetical protein